MKKALSLSLAFLMVISIISGCIVTQAASPIEALPLTGWTKDSYYLTSEEVTPLSFTTAQGLKATAPRNGALGEYPNGLYIGYDENDTRTVGRLGANMKWNTAKDLSDYSAANAYLIFYVKFDKANVFMPAMNLNRNGSGSYEWSVKINTEYSYLPLGGSEWQTAITGDEGYSRGNAGQTYDTRKCYGTMSFDDAFEGYIKVPVSSFATQAGITNAIDLSTDKLISLWFRVKGLGGDYGTVTCGPVFISDTETPSTEITVPEDYRPAPVNATSFDCYVARADLENTFNVAEENGRYMLSSDNEISVDDGQIGNKQNVCFDYDFGERYGSGLSATLPNYTALIFHVSTSSANVVVPSIQLTMPSSESGRWNKDYNPIMTVKPGRTISYLADGADDWQTYTAENVSSNAYVFGGIKFDKAFSGYIKIPVSALTSGGSFTMISDKGASDNDKIVGISLRFKGIGGSYGDITVSDMAYVTEDSNNARVSITAHTFATGDINNDFAVDSVDLALMRKVLLAGSTIGTNPKYLNVAGNGGEFPDIRDLVHLKKLY